MIRQIVLFEGVDTAGDVGLWETNGTAAGTYELSGISGAYYIFFQPTGFVAFNGGVLFNGIDAVPSFGLWETNGTAAGTYELTGISGVNVNGLSPNGLTVFDGEVLFAGTDASGLNGLWVTNGTAAGTTEVGGLGNAGINGASSFGIFSGGVIPDITVFNGEVLFDGIDSSDHANLWVTNGMAGGTHELTGISGAASSLNPRDFTAFNNEVLFAGNGFDVGLWVTNGTAAGTYELTGISGAFSQGIFTRACSVPIESGDSRGAQDRRVYRH